MRIGYDLRRIQNPGIGRYMRQLVEAVLRVAPDNNYCLIVAPGTELTFARGRNAQVLETGVPYYSVSEQVVLPRIARANDLEIFHSPHFLMPILSPCPVVVTIHDCIYITCPEDLGSSIGRAYYRAMMQAAGRRSDRIITDSEFSKADIVRHLGVNENKVEVIPCAVDHRFTRITSSIEVEGTRRKYGISGEFVFYTGIFKPRKNHANLLQAFAQMRRSGVEGQLVLGGPLGAGEDALRTAARRLGIGKDVVFAGFIPDDDLPALYSAARVYACPSTYEGFGFTVLEAMACGTPVVCHRGTSLPEVCGDAAVYADAYDPDDFSFAMKRVFVDDSVRRGCVERGLVQAERFDWDRTARRTLDLYAEVLNRREVRRWA